MKFQIDPKRLNRFIVQVKALKKKRLPIKTLWKMFASVFPDRPQGTEQNLWLSECLEQMEREGIIKLPSPKSSRWDRSFKIPLPNSVDCIRPAPAPVEKPWTTFPWHSLLQWVPDLKHLTSKQFEFLKQVQTGLVNDYFHSLAPFKYRSLQLTGHEKGLQSLLKTQIFGPGRLDLRMLGCIADVVPLAWESISPEPSVIVFENAGPFSVARTVLNQLNHSPYGMIAYGGGKSFESSVQHLLTIGRPIQIIHYVGDIDIAGLTIAKNAKRVAEKSGLPTIKAAPGLHRAMLDAAQKFGHPEGWSTTKEKVVDQNSLTTDIISFLPPDVRNKILEILTKNRRIPEEVFGPLELHKIWNDAAATLNTPV